MSRNYKFHNPEGIYFVSFATVYWIDVFVRDRYFDVLLESLKFCQKELGMVIYAYCFMPSHVHLIFSADHKNHGELLKSFKTYTSKKMQAMIAEDPQESRKTGLAFQWMLWMMERAGSKNSNVKGKQFWHRSGEPSA